MTLHNKPEYNDPDTHAALAAHGMKVSEPDILADAFRLGRASAAPDWKPQRCAECDCKYGGAACHWILCPNPNTHSEEAD